MRVARPAAPRGRVHGAGDAQQHRHRQPDADHQDHEEGERLDRRRAVAERRRPENDHWSHHRSPAVPIQGVTEIDIKPVTCDSIYHRTFIFYFTFTFK